MQVYLKNGRKLQTLLQIEKRRGFVENIAVDIVRKGDGNRQPLQLTTGEHRDVPIFHHVYIPEEHNTSAARSSASGTEGRGRPDEDEDIGEDSPRPSWLSSLSFTPRPSASARACSTVTFPSAAANLHWTELYVP